jgi:hypothetical protein
MVSVATIALGSMWRNMIVRSHAQRAGRADVFEVARAQEFGPHHADERGPAEQHHHENQQPETSPEDREQDDDDVKLGVEFQISITRWKIRSSQPAEKPCTARRDADDRGATVTMSANRPTGGSRRSPAPARRAWCRRCRASGPRRAARARPADVVDRVVAVGDQRPDDPALVRARPRRCRFLASAITPSGSSKHSSKPARDDQALHLDVAIDRLGAEIAAELRLG